jgi:hypothetical protein
MTARTPLQVWDDRWCRWHALTVARGKTPNAAIPVAYELTEDQLGPRPDVEQAEARSS